MAGQKLRIRPIRGPPTEDQMSSCFARFVRWIPTCDRSMGARVSRIGFWGNWPAKSSGFGRFVGPQLRTKCLHVLRDLFVGFQFVTDRWVRVCPESDSGKIGPPKVQDSAESCCPNLRRNVFTFWAICSLGSNLRPILERAQVQNGILGKLARRKSRIGPIRGIPT